jgi:hypothetical protein
VLILVGALALLYPTITYTTEETVLDVGPLEVTTEEENRVPLAPILGGTAVVVGIGLLFVRRRA